MTIVLAGCGTTAPSTSPAPASKKGGFYQDDGPPDRAITDPSQVIDAVPRVEPFHPYANRPYSALGRSYRPMTEDKPYRARGLASWYGRQFHGSRTSTGEIYDMYAASAAHPTLPIPSYARVTNVRSGTSIVVRVNDRGPFKHDRVIDLSYAAAVKLGIASAGTGEVEVVRLTFDDIRALGGSGARAPVTSPTAAVPGAAANPGIAAASPAATAVPVSPAQVPAATVTAIPAANAPAAPAPLPPVTGAAVATPPAPVAMNAASSPDNASTPGVPPTSPPPQRADAGRWTVQVGAFQLRANADVARDRVAAQMQQSGNELATLAAQRPPRVEQDGSIFRVLVGAVADRAQAQALAQLLERLLGRETLLLMR